MTLTELETGLIAWARVLLGPDIKIIWTDQNKGRLKGLYATLEMVTDDPVTPAAISHTFNATDNDLDVVHGTTNEITLRIQTYRTGAYDALREARKRSSLEVARVALRDNCLTLVDILALNRATLNQDTKREERAFMDVTIRYRDTVSEKQPCIAATKITGEPEGSPGIPEFTVSDGSI